MPPMTDARTNTLRHLKGRGLSYTEIAAELNRIGIPAPRGTEWTREMARIAYGHVMSGRDDIDDEPVRQPEKLSVISWEDDRLEVIRLRATGLSIPKVAAAMNDDGRKAPRGGPWTNSAVQRALEYVPHRGNL